MGLRRQPKPKKKREPGSRKARGAIAAVLLAVIGFAGLVAFVKGAEDRALAGERLVDVLVVSDRVEAGTPVEEMKGDVKVERVAAKVRAEGAVADLTEVSGKVASVDLLPGEQVTSQRLMGRDEFGRTGGQVAAAEGMLEVTISLEPQRVVGGVIRPGSTVGVLASFEPFDQEAEGPANVDGIIVPQGGKTPNSTALILRKVQVTNVQATLSGGFGPGGGDDGEEGDTASAPKENLLVTLALPDEAVERVVFAAEFGRIWLAYEPTDAEESGTRVQTRGTIYQ